MLEFHTKIKEVDENKYLKVHVYEFISTLLGGDELSNQEKLDKLILQHKKDIMEGMLGSLKKEIEDLQRESVKCASNNLAANMLQQKFDKVLKFFEVE